MENYWNIPPDPDYLLKQKIRHPVQEDLKVGISPDSYFQPRVFFWFPTMFFPEFVVRCLDGTCDGEMKSAGQATFPRRCYGLKENYYIFSQRLFHFNYRVACSKCHSCRISVCDPRIMRQYPDWILSKFPFILTESAAIHEEVMELLMDGVENGIGPSQVY